MTRQNKFRLLRIVANGLVSVATLDLMYRFNNTLKQSYGEAVKLSDLDITPYPGIEWIEEGVYDSEMNEEALPFIKQFEHEGSVLSKDIELKYLMYLKNTELPTIFIVHGFNEYKEKYRELIYYFIQLDYNVVVYDARGHGNSRTNSDQRLIDIEDFNGYVNDLKTVIDSMKSIYHFLGNFILFGHSMGGAVGTAFLYEYPKVFKAAILSSPMLSIDTYPYPRSVTYTMAQVAKLLNQAHQPIPSQGSNEVVEASTKADEYSLNKELTYSENRGRYYFNLNRKFNEPTTSGGTMNWLSAAMRQSNVLTRSEYLETIQLPILMFQSMEDKVVRADGIYTGATYLPNVDLVAVENVGHELYLEHDQVIRPYVSLIGYFLKQHS